jgi:glycogen synthase
MDEMDQLGELTEKIKMLKPDADFVFEISWEICNRVGGIYTVIKSKISQMMELYPNYILIGPYFEANAKNDFTPMDPPQQYKEVIDGLRSEGITCHYGQWSEIKGNPTAILIDFSGFIGQKDRIKYEMWNDFHIDSLRGDWDFEEPCIWSYCAGRLIERMQGKILDGKKTVAQFHEWLGAFGLLYLKKHCLEVATVFTTHATILGRTLASNGADLYSSLDTFDPLKEAYNNRIEAKYLTERIAAVNADVFTTVSEITSIEAEKFLGRKADVLLLNGLDMQKFPDIEETSLKHISSRNRIREFLTYYFFPYYSFDVNNTLIFYTVGRYEFRNKGYDIIIRALGRLNQMMKDEASANKESHKENPSGQKDGYRNIAFIFWVPMEQYGLKLEALENKNYYMHIKQLVNANAPDILTKIIYDFLVKKNNDDIFTDSFMREIRKDIIAFERSGNPPFTTHNMNEGANSVINALKAAGLWNRKEDPVKAIVEPVYLDGTDGFIDMAYYDAMIGCHLGLFPSYYEPWGYTPLESAALSVPALTTDLSGFGRFIKSQGRDKKGIFVIDRFKKNDDTVVEELAKTMMDFSRLPRSERMEHKLNARALASMADWKILIDNYVTAHNLALSKRR